ncbi:MAG: hypothetical protein AB1297_08125 [bacterium]
MISDINIFMDTLFSIILFFLGICTLLFPPIKVFVDSENLRIIRFFFPLRIQWKDIISIKAFYFLGTLATILEFSQENKKRRARIGAEIVGYQELLRDIVEKANNAVIDQKIKDLLEGKDRYILLWLSRLIFFIGLLIIYGAFVWL